MHLYNFNFVYQELNEVRFDITGYDAELTSRDGIFSIKDFIKDLGKLFITALFHETLEVVCVAVENATYNLFLRRKMF